MSDEFVKRTCCPVCECSSFTNLYSALFSAPSIWSFIESYYGGKVPRETVESDLYRIARCDRCGLLFQEFILNESNMFLLYEKWISAESSLDKKRFSGIQLFRDYAREIDGICGFLQKKPHEIDVLDFGMGWGFWLQLAKGYNFNVTGVELSESRIEYARQNGLRVISDLRQEGNESYDYIYASQVFEHLPEPSESMRELARLLRSGGVIHIQVPNGMGVERGLRARNWVAKKDAVHPLEHINCFRRQSLKTLATRAGLSLGRPLYRPRWDGIRPFVKSQVKYLYDLSCSTQVYLRKP